jgi:aminopeptidase N
MGVDTFNEGITAYLNKYSYSNAEQSQLWAELDKVADFEDFTTADIMDTWTRQMGYPVVNVERNGNELKASQVNLRRNLVPGDANT